MNLSISEFAKSKGVSYESVRKQVAKREKELKDYIIIENGVKKLTDQAQDILNGKKPVVIVQDDKLQAKAYQERLDEKDQRIKELEDEIKDIKLQAELKYTQLENKVLEKVVELSEQKSLVDNSKLLLEQKDNEKAKLEEEKDKQIDLMATNRQARKEYKKAKKKQEKELKKQAKENTDD